MNTEDTIRKGLNVLFTPGQVIELRAIGERTQYGYYTDVEKLARDAAVLDTTPGLSGIYITLNTVNPVLLARCANRVKKAVNREPQTGDGDILRRCWLPVDIDPVRPAGISSSDQEHEASLKKAGLIRQFLSGLGWPDPVLADSGNGAHLLYRTDLPNDVESSDLIRGCLKTLAHFFSDDESEVDTAVFNPARIWKLYGTRSRKGDHTDERPHRISGIRSVPEVIAPVQVTSLMQLISLSGSGQNEHPKVQEHIASGRIDLGLWLSDHGFSYSEKPYYEGRLFVFDQCPFSSAHKDGAYAIQFANGAIFAGCHHTSCGGNTQRWQELRSRYEPPATGRKQGRLSLKQVQTGTIPTKPTLDHQNQATKAIPAGQDDFNKSDDDPDILAEATRVLREGDPIRYILDSFASRHEGDQIVARCLVMSLASRSVLNSNGLHVLVTGESGKGKSHTFETMLNLIPQEHRLSGRMSDKALFYMKDLQKGSVISLDDISLSDQMQEVLKGVTTSFRTPFIYRTVDKDRNGLTKVIPERCLWWIAKVEGTGDDQIWNRMLTVWIDDSQEQDNRVLARELSAAASLKSPDLHLPWETRVCRAIWNGLEPVSVVIPFAERIRFSSSKNRRNPSMLLDLIRSVAVMHQYQRVRKTEDGMVSIIATKGDFEEAKTIYLLLNGESGGQMTKLTRSESMLVQAIRENNKTYFTINDLQKIVGKTHSTIYRMLKGKPGSMSYNGLLEKCPPLSLYNRAEQVEEGVYRRGNVYTWDEEMDRQWSSGGGCWLDESDDPGTHENGNGSDDSPGDTDGVSLHHCTTFPEHCTQKCNDKVNDSDLNSNNIDNNTHSYLSLHTYPDVRNDSPYMTSSPRAPGNSAMIENNDTDTTELPGDSGIDVISPLHEGVHRSCTDVPGMQCPDDLQQQSGGKSRVRIQDIDPDAYIRLTRAENLTCDCCKKKRVLYRKRGESKYSGICERCYSKAVSRQVLTFQALPGVLPLAGMKKTDRNLGRCRLCNLREITWWDEETKTGLCASCYYRERFNARALSSGVKT